MNKCLKLTMTVAAVALMCVSFAPQAQAYNEGDLGVIRFNYLPQNPDSTIRAVDGYQNSNAIKTQVWPSYVYNETFGGIELPVHPLQGTSPNYEPAGFSIPVRVSETGFPNMITWNVFHNYQNGVVNDISFFRVNLDGSVTMWAQNGPFGPGPYGDLHGQYTGFDPINVSGCAASYGSAAQIYVLGNAINVGACLQMGSSYTLEQGAGGGGGGADLSGLEAGQAAIEAKLDNLPAGPQGPAGDAGPTGDAGADAACTPCADVTDAAVALACEILGENPPTSVSALQATSQVVVDTLLISTNICEADCDISAGIQAAIDAKLSQ